MPIYNGEKYLVEAIESILSQTFTDFELIVVDDGSVDSTPGILADYSAKDDRVRVISQANGGIVTALNAGLSRCRGEYIARMDADDISKKDRFAFQAAYLDANPTCVLVGGLADSIRPDGSLGSELTSGGRHKITNLDTFPPRIAVSLHPLIMVRLSALKAVGGYRNMFPHAEDYDLFIRLSAHGTIDNPRIVVLTYRRHGDAASIKHLEKQELSAAQAEVDARRARGLSEINQAIFDAYVCLRIWRRYQNVDPAKAVKMALSELSDLFSINPRYFFSLHYWRLRVLIVANMLRFVKRRLPLRRNKNDSRKSTAASA
jgi:glycosyltransferase involved in cell wall biosynthesis